MKIIIAFGIIVVLLSILAYNFFSSPKTKEDKANSNRVKREEIEELTDTLKLKLIRLRREAKEGRASCKV